MSVALVIGIILSLSLISTSAKNKTVYLGGQPFGLKFYNNGVILIELEHFFDGINYTCPAKKGGLKENDIIKEIDGQKVDSNEDLQNIVTSSNGKALSFIIERNEKKIEKSINPEKNIAGMYLIGAWVRDSCAGIGTVTYYDKENNYFAALGHGVCDKDTSGLLPLRHGEVVQSNISGVTKSTKGKAGSLDGYFTDKSFGVLTKNTSSGIYGTICDNFNFNQKSIEIANCDEINTGRAEVYTTISGTEPRYYDIKISKICNTNKNTNENFVITVTDDELIDSCGGIVQGMSGSPIIQNGKLVGAITHVFVNSPCDGYGVLAQNMVSVFEE